MRPSSIAFVFLLGTAQTLHAARVQAEESPPRTHVHLAYILGPGTRSCPNERVLHDAVAERLGYDPFVDAEEPAERRMIARITREDRQYAYQLKVFDGADQLVWDPPAFKDMSCPRLVRLLALAIESDLATPPPPPKPPPPLVVSAPPPPPPRTAAKPEPEDTPKPYFGIKTAVEIGLTPTWTPSLSLDAGLRWPHFALAAEAKATLPLAGTTEVGSRMQAMLLAGSLVACGYISLFFGCALYGLGLYRGGDTRAVRDDSIAYNSAGLRLGLEVPFSPGIGVHVAGDLLKNLQVTTVSLDDRRVWRSGPLVGMLGGGMHLYF